MKAGFVDVSIDEVRNYWDRRPCNIRHSPLPVGTGPFFVHAEARKYFVAPHIRGFAEFERWSGKSISEIGCGIGTDTMSFARSGARVTAVDVSAASVDLARTRAEALRLSDRIEFHIANAENLADHIPPRKHDLIYSLLKSLWWGETMNSTPAEC